MGKMKEKFNVGWQQKCGKAMKHFFVGELPLCGTKILPLHPVTGSNNHVAFCKRCISSLESALDKSR